MNIKSKFETWKIKSTGKEVYYQVYRDEKGHFVKGFKRVNISAKIQREKDDKAFYPKEWIDKGLKKAGVFINNVPIHSTRQTPNYHNFGLIVIDREEKIDLAKMKQELIDYIEDKLHYKLSDFWFYIDWGYMYPKPTGETIPDKIFEDKKIR